MNELPLSIRDVSPHPEATRITGINPSGLPGGVHTGGVWLYNGEIYKPLDGRPFANCEHHYPTEEKELLEARAGEFLFPKNWRFEELNGRRFIVRKKAYLIPEDLDYRSIKRVDILKIEEAIRATNRAGWQIGDDIALAVDPDSYELFLYDLSTAHRFVFSKASSHLEDEEWRIYAFFEQTKVYAYLKTLRSNASHITSSIDFWDKKKEGYCFVYASFNRPISSLWASIPGDPIFVHNDRANWQAQIPHSWIVTKQALDEDTIKRYELTIGYIPTFTG